jgi:hypothetical protein
VGSGKQNGEAILVGAREGAALPLFEFDFEFKKENNKLCGTIRIKSKITT